MATALHKTKTIDMKNLAIQCQQLKDNTGAAVNITELTAFSGTTATATELNKLAGVTAGTVTASKAVVVDANKAIDTIAIPVGGLKIGAGAGTAVTASAAELNTMTGILATTAELNRVADVSTRTILAGSTLAMTEAAHESKIILLDQLTGSVVTLPASTGGGAIYRILVLETATSNSHVIKVANASDEFRGYVIQDSDTATAPNIWWAADNDDTITLNRTTTGLAAQGEYFDIVDAKLNHYYVRGYSQASGTEATPFSATV
jgi:hypothetical protein